jgi:2-polyprenyl-6-methoxyphenol hydroxylase-like FAD-dependent oxidoreductase
MDIHNVQFEDFVVTTIEDRAAKREYQIRSKQFIGCDGAKSRVRESLGVTCEGDITREC